MVGEAEPMPWRLVEVPEDGEGTLSDWEVIGIKTALESAARSGNPGYPANSAFGRIWNKLLPLFERAIANDQDERSRLENYEAIHAY
jgi:hypothetical protein